MKQYTARSLFFFYLYLYISQLFPSLFGKCDQFFHFSLSLPFSISLFLYFATFVTRVWILLSHLECPIAFLISPRRCRYTALSALCSPSFFPRYDKFFSLCLSFSPSYAIAPRSSYRLRAWYKFIRSSYLALPRPQGRRNLTRRFVPYPREISASAERGR